MEHAIQEIIEEPYELDELEDLEEVEEYDADLAQPEKLFPGRSGWYAALGQLPGARDDEPSYG